MSGDPFLIAGKALISFSGGRTSAYMLWRILQAHGGKLPEEITVAFANTGREREPTLRFVYECSVRWGVRVRWLEFVTDLASVGAGGRFQEVGFNSASRDGEPLSKLIARKQALFSTMSGRWCTERCKVGVLTDFMASNGLERGSYTEVIGFRADESDRVYELPRRSKNLNRRFSFPLARAGVRKDDVNRFWAGQPFDLQLRLGMGNCDHCPFLSDKSRIARARLDPHGLEWWDGHEKAHDFSFGYMSIDKLRLRVTNEPLLPLGDFDVESAESDCGHWCGADQKAPP